MGHKTTVPPHQAADVVLSTDRPGAVAGGDAAFVVVVSHEATNVPIARNAACSIGVDDCAKIKGSYQSADSPIARNAAALGIAVADSSTCNVANQRTNAVSCPPINIRSNQSQIFDVSLNVHENTYVVCIRRCVAEV